MAKKKRDEVYWADRLMCDALRFLRDSDGKASVRDVRVHILHNSDIPEKRKQPGARGRPLWESGMEFHSIRYVRAGFLRKEKGVWHITPLGLSRFNNKSISDAGIGEEARVSLQPATPSNQPPLPAVEDADDLGDGDDVASTVSDSLDEYHATANASISEHIESIDPFEFQNLVAALFRGMGYYVREVSPQNTPDGGIDVIAYQGGDVLGAKTPRIKAQVKRQQSKTGKPELQKLLGAMTDGDIGVFVSTGGFARGCGEFAKQQNRQLELIDMPRFIELWRDNYDKLSDEDKSLLPLQPIYFLDEERVKRS